MDKVRRRCISLLVLVVVFIGVGATRPDGTVWVAPLFIEASVCFCAVPKCQERKRIEREQLEKDKTEIVGMIDEVLSK